jgi:protocatechuate 3,4-dioxygenase beta subunit
MSTTNKKRTQAVFFNAMLILALAAVALIAYFVIGRRTDRGFRRHDRTSAARVATGSERVHDAAASEDAAEAPRISGTVLSANGREPLRGIVITGRSLAPYESAWRDTTRSLFDGTYSLCPYLLEDEEPVEVIARSGRGQWLSRKLILTFRAGEPVEGVDFMMTRETDITVSILDCEDNSPVGDVEMEIKIFHGRSKHTHTTAPSEAAGEYVLRSVSAGGCRININAEGYVPYTSHVRVTEAGQSFAFRIERAASLAGRVINESGKPVTGAEVIFRIVGGRQKKSVTDENGEYTITGISPCKGGLAVRHPDYADAVAALVEVEKGCLTTRDVTMTRGVTVGGIVTDLSGAPVKGAEVRMALHLYHVKIARAGKTGGDGKYQFVKVAPGTYSFHVRSPGHVQQRRKNVRIHAGEDGQVFDFSLDPGAAIRGRAVDSSGEPVPGVCVRVVHTSRETATDERGEFTVAGLLDNETCDVEFIPENYAYTVIRYVRPPADLGSVVLEGFGTLRGKVVWGDNPLPSATIRIRRSSDPGIRFRQATDDAGLFIFKNLRPGDYHVEVTSEGFQKYEYNGLIKIREGLDSDVGLVELVK